MSGTQARVGGALALAPALSCSGGEPECLSSRKAGAEPGCRGRGGSCGLGWAAPPHPAPSKAVSWPAGKERQATVFALDRARSVFPDGAGTGRELWRRGARPPRPSFPGRGKTQTSVFGFFLLSLTNFCSSENRVCFEPELELDFL